MGYVIALVMCTLFLPQCSAQDSPRPNSFKDVADRLQSLTRLQLTGCRWHSDIAHPEDPGIDDAGWKTIELGATFESGVQDLRCKFKVPRQVRGYDIQGATLKVAFDFQGDGMTMLSIFSNTHNVYRGNADTLEPITLTTDGHPDESFVVSVRLEVGDQPRKLARSEVLIEPDARRPDPEWLRTEILSLQPILGAYPDPQRTLQLESAVRAIDFSKLDAGDQAGFDVSLANAQAKLQQLNPWIK